VQANKIIPGWLDHYLGRTGYDAQQTSESEDPNRPNNLWQPGEGDGGAHGRFDAQASASSPELWISSHRPSGRQWITVGAAVAGAAPCSPSASNAPPDDRHSRQLGSATSRAGQRAAVPLVPAASRSPPTSE